MKKLTPNKSWSLAAAAGLAIGLLAPNANANTSLWFDQNGSTSGYGNGGSWDASNWATTSGGTKTTGPWVDTCFARFNNAANQTITVGRTELTGGMYQQTGFSTTFNDDGSGLGAIGITSSGSTAISGVTGGNVQGFLIASGGSLVFNVPVVGDGGIEQQTSGSIVLNKTNSYAGGTWVTGGQGIFYNCNYAFGTGVIYMGGSGGWFENDSGLAVLVTNKMIWPTANYNYNFVSGPAVGGLPGTTWAGPVTLPASGTTKFNIGGSGNDVAAFSNVISGASALNISDNGLCILAGTNTYTGATGVGNYTGGTTPSLEIAGQIAGDLIVTNGTKLVKLDHAATLKSTAKVSLVSSLAAGAVNLAYSGTMQITALYIDGVLQPAGTYGSATSGAANPNAIFTGNGQLYIPAAPVIVTQPKSTSVYPQTASRTFSFDVTGDTTTMSYQWKFNGNNLSDNAPSGPNASGSQTSQLTLYPPFVAGTYTCYIQNVAGNTTTQPATLSILATNDYVNAILTDNPIGYWRLDETSGTTANDWVGLHAATYNNVNLNQPGFSVVANSDPAISVPQNTSQRGYVGYANAAPDFTFTGNPYTMEAWAYSTNFSANQRIISQAANAGGGVALSFPNASSLQFTLNGKANGDWTVSVPTMSAGTWYHCVVTFDGSTYTLYMNGTQVGTKNVADYSTANPPTGQLCFGNDDPTFPVSEQLKGGVDEVAFYGFALSSDRVLAHYLARYTDAPLSVSTPTVTPSSNYVSLSATLNEAASGAGLTYQWYHGAGTGSPVGGPSTSSSHTIAPLQLSDAGSYHCVVTDAGNHTADTPMCTLNVVAIPTSAQQLNLTNGLVLHLPFDSDYKDISGRNNDGTAVGAPSFGTGAAIGSGALHYSTSDGSATNYVTLGVPADLQFGAATSFTVSYWVRGTGTAGLPFICDSTNGMAGIAAYAGGFYFGPDAAGDGGWTADVGSAAHVFSTSGAATINDGGWHHFVHVADRAGNMVTYLDGTVVDTKAMSFVTDSINSGLPVNIGQASGAPLSPTAASGDIDDVAIWNRTLSTYEVDGIWLAGSVNHVSMAPVVISAPPLTATTISSITATTLSYTGGSGTHFVLQGTTNLVAPTWERLLTNTASPGSFTLPTSSSASMFYRVSSEN